MQCSHCLVHKDAGDFYLHSNGKPRKQCKQCLVARKTPNPEVRNKAVKKYREKYPEKIRERYHQWRLNNLEYDAYRAATYRARKLQQTPSWADLKKIEEIYLNCPKGHHVDHVIPLKGKTVRGLHVETNLQYLPAKENLAKRNLYGAR